MKHEKDLQFVKDCLNQPERLAQLAEEASELSKAALKVRRCLDGSNPSRTPKEDAWKDLFEEIADVLLSLAALDLDTDSMVERYRDIQEAKVQRWARMLENK